MRFLFPFLFLFAALPLTATAGPEFCRSTRCNPYSWVWYPRTPPGMPYGREVRLNGQGEWVDRDGRRVWAQRGSRYATLLSPMNSDERNGELAYITAYDSYVQGKEDGTNKVEKVSLGRWVRKITTGDGVVLYKDAAGNVAVQSPDGTWHVTDSRGRYASSSPELMTREPERRMVAKAAPKRTSPAKKKVLLSKAKPKAKKDGRKLASLAKPVPAQEEPAAKPAEEAKPAEANGADAQSIAQSAPASSADSPKGNATVPDASKIAELGKTSEAAKLAQAMPPNPAPEKAPDKTNEMKSEKAPEKAAEEAKSSAPKK